MIMQSCVPVSIPPFRHASLYEKLLLRGVLAQFKKSGMEEATLREVYEQVREKLASEGKFTLLCTCHSIMYGDTVQWDPHPHQHFLVCPHPLEITPLGQTLIP